MPEAPFSFDRPLKLSEIETARNLARQRDPVSFGTMSLQDFSRFMNETVGGTAFNAGTVGMPGQIVETYNEGVQNLPVLHGLTEGLKAGGEAVGSALGGLVGPKTEKWTRETAGSFGEMLPRLGLQVGLSRVPKVGLPLAATDILAQGYSETQSVPAAVVNAATFFAAPALGAKVGSKVLGPTLTQDGAQIAEKFGMKEAARLGQTIPKTGGQIAASTAARLGTTAAGFEAGGELASGLASRTHGGTFAEGLYNPLSPDAIGKTLATLLPFEVAHAFSMRKLRAKNDEIVRGVEEQKAVPMPEDRVPASPVPTSTPRPVAEFAGYDLGSLPTYKVPGARPGWFSNVSAETATKQGFALPDRVPTFEEWKATQPPPMPKPTSKLPEGEEVSPGQVQYKLPIGGEQSGEVQKGKEAVTPQGAGVVPAPPVPTEPTPMQRLISEAQSFDLEKHVADAMKTGQYDAKNPGDAWKIISTMPEALYQPVMRAYGTTAGQFPKLVQQMMAGEKVARKAPVDVKAMFPRTMEGTPFGMMSEEVLSDPMRYLKLTPDKTGKLDAVQLLARLRLTLSPTEFEMLDSAGMVKEFQKRGKMTAEEARKWAEEKAPRVEVRTFALNNRIANRDTYREERNRISHELETLGYDLGGEASQARTPEHRALFDRILQLDDIISGPEGWGEIESGGTHWSSTAPKPEKDMPGYVEVAVVKPLRNVEAPAERKRFVRADGTETEAPKFPSSHNFPPNTLGFARGYMETLPSGEKVFHIIEVQSDWAQRVRREKETGIREGREETGDELDPIRYKGAQDDPLLRDHQRLVLKAVIDHAIKQGADRIALSDAETAMMTEGHDTIAVTGRLTIPADKKEQAVRDGWSVDENNSILSTNVELRKAQKLYGGTLKPAEITQEAGMRLNYDKIIPQILQELTGNKRERVEFGEHKMAFAPEYGTQDYGNVQVPRTRVRDNLIFKNPDGTPKTSVSAHAYALSKTKRALLARRGFSLLGKDKVDSILREMEANGATPEQLLRAHEALRGEPVRAGEKTPEDIAARRADLDQQNEPGTLMESALRFFTESTRLRGYTPEQANVIVRNAMRVAARFLVNHGKVRVVPAEGDASFAVPPREGRLNQFIGVLQDKNPASKSIALFKEMWAFAHELIHQEEFLRTSEYQNIVLAANKLTPSEQGEAVKTMLKALMPKPAFEAINWTDFNKLYSEQGGREEFIADYVGLLALGAEKPNALADVMWFSTRETQNFARGLYKDVTAVFQQVVEFLKRVGAKMGIGPERWQHLNDINAAAKKVMLSYDEADRAMNAFMGTVDMMDRQWWKSEPPVSYRDLEKMYDVTPTPVEVSQMVPRMKEFVNDAMKKVEGEVYGFPIKVPMWKKFFPWSQLVDEFKNIPTVGDVFYLGKEILSKRTEAMDEFFKLFRKPGTAEEFDSKRWNTQGTDNSLEGMALTEVSRYQTATETYLETRKGREDASPRYKALSDAQKDAVDLSLAQFADIARRTAGMRVRSERYRQVHIAARMLQGRDKTMRWQEAEKMAEDLWDWLHLDTPGHRIMDEKDLQARDLAEKRALQLELSFSSWAMNPANDAVLSTLTELKPAYRELQDVLLGKFDDATSEWEGRPWFSPEVRTKEFQIAAKAKGEKLEYVDFDTAAEAEAYRKAFETKYGGRIEYIKTKRLSIEKEGYDQNPLPEQYLTKFRELENAARDKALIKARNEGYDADTLKFIEEEFAPGDASEMAMRTPHMRTQKRVKGRERVNAVQAWHEYFESTVRYLTNRYVRQKSALMLNDPPLRSQPDLQNMSKQFLKFATNPGGAEWNTLKSLVFFHYMGFKPASLMIEFTQQMLSHVPVLVHEGASVPEAYKLITKSFGPSFRWMISAFQHGHDKATSGRPELDEWIRKAEREDHIPRGLLQEAAQIDQDLKYVSRRRATQGKPVMKAVDLARNGMYHMLNMAMKFYRIAPLANGTAAFISAFDHGRQNLKLPPQQAYEFAVRTIGTSMFGGGRLARPPVLMGMGKATGLGGLVYTLNGYNANMTALMLRFGKEMIKATTQKGWNHAEAQQATKAFGTMIGTTLLFGGLMGLPVSALIGVVNQLFPQAELNYNLKNSLANALTDDEELGNLISEGMLNGIWNTLPGISEADIGARFRLNAILGVDPYKGFQWGNFGGATGAVLESWVKGTKAALQGNVDQAVNQLAPTGFRGIIKAFRDGEVVKNAQTGEPMGTLTPAEVALQTIGFTPRSVTQRYEQQAMIRQHQEVELAKKRTWRAEMADLLLAGKTQEAMVLLKEGAGMFEDFRPKDEIRAVVETALRRERPRDVTAGVSRETAPFAQRVRTLYGMPPLIQSSVADELRQQELTRALGLRPSRGGLREAYGIDQLRTLNPTLLPQQAQMMLERARGRAYQAPW